MLTTQMQQLRDLILPPGHKVHVITKAFSKICLTCNNKKYKPLERSLYHGQQFPFDALTNNTKLVIENNILTYANTLMSNRLFRNKCHNAKLLFYVIQTLNPQAPFIVSLYLFKMVRNQNSANHINKN